MSTLKTLTSVEFKEALTTSSRPMLIDFGADWCPPCRALIPVIEELSREFHGRVDIFKVDVEQNPELAALYMIRSLPTVLVFRDGKTVAELFGKQPKANYEAVLKKLEEIG